jgi:hypothetical protein
MKTRQILGALVLSLFASAAIIQAQGKPEWVPVGPPETPVEKPATPPVDPPDSVIDFVCSIVSIPHLCD